MGDLYVEKYYEEIFEKGAEKHDFNQPQNEIDFGELQERLHRSKNDETDLEKVSYDKVRVRDWRLT